MYNFVTENPVDEHTVYMYYSDFLAGEERETKHVYQMYALKKDASISLCGYICA